jgi:hypothetical protein
MQREPLIMSYGRSLSQIDAVRGAMDQYAFCENEPIANVDIFGLSCEHACDVLPQGVAGGVVCCEGQKIPCVKVPSHKHNRDAIKIISLCLVSHEMKHIPETEPCKPCGTYRPNYLPKVKQRDSECGAHSVELSCYLGAIDYCKGDPDCRAEVIGMIMAAYDAAKHYCKTPPPRPPWTY